MCTYGDLHHYSGLSVGDDLLESPRVSWIHGGNEIVQNPDGSYSAIEYSGLEPLRFHPFALYYMGLWSDVNTQAPLYNMGVFGSTFDFYNPTPHRVLRVSDIVDFEGPRGCAEAQYVRP